VDKPLFLLPSFPSMRFITRQIYEVMQLSGIAPAEFVRRSLDTAFDARRQHHRAIRDRLPASMREFSKLTLHDGVIRSADTSIPGEIALDIDGEGCWGPDIQMRLVFRGVRKAIGLKSLPAIWLYEEVDLHPEAAFEYRVLMHKSSMTIAADTVEFTIKQSKEYRKNRRRDVDIEEYMRRPHLHAIESAHPAPESVASFYYHIGAHIYEPDENRPSWRAMYDFYRIIIAEAENPRDPRLVFYVPSLSNALAPLEQAGFFPTERSEERALFIDPDGRPVELSENAPLVHIAQDGTVTKAR